MNKEYGGMTPNRVEMRVCICKYMSVRGVKESTAKKLIESFFRLLKRLLVGEVVIVYGLRGVKPKKRVLATLKGHEHLHRQHPTQLRFWVHDVENNCVCGIEMENVMRY